MSTKHNIPIKRSPFYTEPVAAPVKTDSTPPEAHKSPKNMWNEIEARYGKPMRDVLRTLHMEHNTYNGMANALGVSWNTLRDWWTVAGLPDLHKWNADGSVAIVICGDTDTPAPQPTTTEGGAR